MLSGAGSMRASARAKKAVAYGKEFWDMADLRQKITDTKAAQAAAYLASLKAEDPAQFEKLVMDSIGSSEGFKLPEKKK